MTRLLLLASLIHCLGCETDPVALDGLIPPSDEALPPPAPRCDAPPALSAIPSACTGPVAGAPDRLDEALAAAALDRCALERPGAAAALLPPEAVADGARQGWIDEVIARPLGLPPVARETVRWLDEAAASDRPVARAIQAAAARMGVPFAVCPEGAVVASSSAPLLDALRALAAARGGSLDESALFEDSADVPLELQEALAPILAAAGNAAAVYERALVGRNRSELESLRSAAWLALPGHAPDLREEPLASWTTGGAFPAAEVYAAAAKLAATIEDASLERFAGLEGVRFDGDSGLGRVVIRDAAAQTHDETDRSLAIPVLLLLDLGGDDTYLVAAGGAGELGLPVSIAIDLGGDDRYGYEERPDPHDGERLPSDEAGRWGGTADGDGPVSLSRTSRQGSARLGIGLLFDLGGGRDEYRSLRMSQGFALFGVGVLYDDGGDDRYACEAGCQGAGLFGIGLLLDADGNDRYRTFNSAQGFGFAGGAGVLYDRAGDDEYFADPGDPAQGGDPLYLVDQLPGAGNRSMAQGMGFGRRADTTRDGVYLSGGVGVLRDAAGDDDYICSVWCQAAGYWFGAGILDDEAGDDDYDALYYDQGAAAHFGAGMFRDGLGEDRYQQRLVPAGTAIGVGHDVSVGVHADLGGGDVYRAPPLSLGAGNDNGVGLFVNLGGADAYEVAGEPSLGAGRTPGVREPAGARAGIATVGVFIDVDGADGYLVGGMPLAHDGTLWTDAAAGLGAAHGVGLDHDGGTVGI
ncbi:MAG: hypothetical protein HY905_27500 [Deltaproteobacteria bacterium]|nr:hypothetical protein [Deltaproteobacteria bacterium]